ncbi:hypothetical protein N7517_007255 [Penicillium concentricum]|uniref:Uncharacterized protein n=1 Tax=Penicillium concentricum TaxID=293559 RepID=A0A9W9VC47_9EURO|nr:uncharacterized protein N7517_007255 [Penicillium concentricum]KAJ5375249.1 hypothetical protein N7517_007255 [Penicillium concentricum]
MERAKTTTPTGTEILLDVYLQWIRPATRSDHDHDHDHEKDADPSPDNESTGLSTKAGVSRDSRERSGGSNSRELGPLRGAVD